MPAVRGTGPPSGKPACDHLRREVEEDSDGEVFFRQTLFEQFEAGHSVVDLETDLANDVDEQERLDICETSTDQRENSAGVA
jgi:hypothetical protein